jgi:hypothetical protein
MQDRIVVAMGPDGVGKTSLCASLFRNEIPLSTQPTMLPTRFQIRGSNRETITIFDLPGRVRNFATVINQLTKRPASTLTILNVVAYGLFANMEHHDGLDLEINWFESMAPVLARLQPFRMITVVTKADLWWDIRDAVIQYYNHEYFEDTSSHVDGKRYAIVPHSSARIPLNDLGFAQSYDDLTRHELVSKLSRLVGLSE